MENYQREIRLQKYLDSQTRPTFIAATKYEFNGQTKSIKEWSVEYGLTYSILYNRLLVYKWDIKKALETPPINVPPKYEELADFSPVTEKERQELNMKAVNEFFHPKVNTYKMNDFDLNDDDARVWALKRAFNLMNKKK